jgi:predicted amidohydrolase
MKISISIAQTNLNVESFEKNVDNTLYLIDQLPNIENHYLLLPELWSTGFTSDLYIASKYNFDLMQILKIWAHKKNIHICGSYIIQQNEKIFTNQLVIISPNKEIIARYNKIHLFPQINEKKLFKSGEKPAILSSSYANFGLSICYDLRFPELFRNYAKNGVNICLLPAQWPLKRISHYTKLLYARAIENQMIMVSANLIGKTNNTIFGGNSMIVDHQGEPIINLESQVNSIATASIDLKKTEEWRKTFPVLKDIPTSDFQNIEYFENIS